MRQQLTWAPYLFVSPFLLLFAVFGIYPIAKSLYLAFHTTNGPRSEVFTGLMNFKFLFEDPDFHTALKNTAIYAFFSVFLQLPLSLGLALLLNQRWLKGREFFRLVFISPHLVGQVFVGLMFQIMFVPRFGLLPRFLHYLFNASADTKWLGDPQLVMPALVFVSLWMYVGFNCVYFLAALQNVDRELYEAADVDGASGWAKFWHITLPAIKPVAVVVAVMSTIGSFQLYELPYMLLGQGPGPNKSGLTIVMYLYQNGFETGNLGYASAIGWTLALIVLCVSLVQARLSGAFSSAALTGPAKKEKA